MQYRVDMIIDVPDNMSMTEIEDFIMDGIIRMAIDEQRDVDVLEFIDIEEI